MSALSAAVMALPTPESIPCPRCRGAFIWTGEYLDAMGNAPGKRHQKIVRCSACKFVWWTVRRTIKNPSVLPERDGQAV